MTIDELRRRVRLLERRMPPRRRGRVLGPPSKPRATFACDLARRLEAAAQSATLEALQSDLETREAARLMTALAAELEVPRAAFKNALAVALCLFRHGEHKARRAVLEGSDV